MGDDYALLCEDLLLLAPPLEPPETLLPALTAAVDYGLEQDWPQGFSPLHWACESCRRDIADFLLQKACAGPLSRPARAVQNAAMQSSTKALLSPNHAALARWFTRAASVAPDSDKMPLALSTPEVQKEFRLLLPSDPSLADVYAPPPDCAPAADHGFPQSSEVVRRQNYETFRTSVSSSLPNSSLSPSDFDSSAQAGRQFDSSALHSRGQSTVRHSTETISMPAPGTTSEEGEADEYANVPERYLNIMRQIDNRGWGKIDWACEFTLLHWAAKHDKARLCVKFLRQRADPRHRDESGKDALDFARENQSHKALACLEAELQR